MAIVIIPIKILNSVTHTNNFILIRIDFTRCNLFPLILPLQFLKFKNSDWNLYNLFNTDCWYLHLNFSKSTSYFICKAEWCLTSELKRIIVSIISKSFVIPAHLSQFCYKGEMVADRYCFQCARVELQQQISALGK